MRDEKISYTNINPSSSSQPDDWQPNSGGTGEGDVYTNQTNRFTRSQIITGSLYVSGSLYGDGSQLTNLPIPDINTGSLVTTGSFNSYTSSTDDKIASLTANTSSYATTSSVNTIIGDFNAYTSSNDSQMTSLVNSTGSYVISQSFNEYTSSINNYTSSLNNKTGSFTTTGSNTFIGNQTISGSLIVTEGITGSFSHWYIGRARTKLFKTLSAKLSIIKFLIIFANNDLSPII